MASSASSSTPPHVLLVLTDQQSLWTISAYHRLLRDGGYASAADFGLGRAPAWAPLPTPQIDALNLTDEIFVSNKEGDTEMECTYDEFATMVARMARAKTSKGGAGIDTTGDGKADTVLGQMAVDTTGDGHADTVLETPFEVTLDSWLGLYFVPSFMEMLKKAKKSGGLSFN